MGETGARIRSEDYTALKDFRMEVEVPEERNFIFCFWVYLFNSKAAKFPATIIKQVHSDITSSAPFVVLDEKKTMAVFPLLLLHKDAAAFGKSISLPEVPHASTKIEFPLEKWIHIGCEIITSVLRLLVNGEIIGEQSLSSTFKEDSSSNRSRKMTFVGVDGDDGWQGYVHNPEVLPLSLSIKEHYFKDPPLQLLVNDSTTADIEEDIDGVWSIVGGKASCRRIFSIDVILFNAVGHAMNKESEVVASLVYADNRQPVQKSPEDEAPLLTSYDGIEFASSDRPSKLLHGRASFKLKISQLSSKCDGRLFCVKFEIQSFKGYRFLETFSRPIRCISRSRNARASFIAGKRPMSTMYPVNGSKYLVTGHENSKLHNNSIHGMNPDSSSKRVKVGQEITSMVKHAGGECNSHPWTDNQVEKSVGLNLGQMPKNYDEANNSPHDSESTVDRDSDIKALSTSDYSVTDLTIFKYCLGGLIDRAILLKDIATSASEEVLVRLAHEVSLYSGCSHHRHQIMNAKSLIEDGTKVWNSIAQTKRLVHWDSAVPEIEAQFMKITRCSTRSLTKDDFELLKRIAGCREFMAKENFEKMWCWLYPIAHTISRDLINNAWDSTSPKWIEGFITKEQAEMSLRGPQGMQDAGTFILRFPTSRSWPHPDAGSLIVSYVGHDCAIRHRMLSVDYIFSSAEREMNAKPLQEMLLEDPALTRLGRIIRSQ